MPSRYFLYALRYFEQKLAEKATGTTFAAISGKVLRDQKVPLAPLPEQHRIVAKIEELLTDLDAGIAALKQAQANLKRYKAAVLSAACQGRLAPQDPNDEPAAKLLERILAERRATTRRATARVAPTTPAPTVGASLADAPLPDGWCWASVEQLAQSIQYGYTESAQQEPIGPKFLRITDIQNGQVDWGAVPYCACSENDYQKYRLQTGDIVFARTGATTGKSYLISVCPDAVFASYLIRLRLAGCVVNGYFALFLDSPMYWSQIITVRKGSAQPGVNATILATLHVPLPPLAEQRRIVAEVERRLSVAQELEASISANLARAERLRQSILKRAFEGKLVPQDPNDEPASVLLEKIRANRVGATLAVAPDAVAHDAATLRAGASPAPTKDEKSL